MLSHVGNAIGALEIARRNVARAKPVPPKKEAPPDQIALPFWPEGDRALPNELLRTALFAARNRKQPRVFLCNEKIATIGDIDINYTGEELRQDDATVVFHLVHLVRQQGTSKARFSTRAFCRALGWGTDGRSYARLRKIFTRLQATALSVQSPRLGSGVSLSLLPKFAWQKNGEMQEVCLDPALVRLFDNNHFSRVEWSQRLALPVGLATWLQGYFASHRRPFPVRLDAIREGAGLTMCCNKDLRAMVSRALKNLKKVGFLVDWEVRGELVIVVRSV